MTVARNALVHQVNNLKAQLSLPGIRDTDRQCLRLELTKAELALDTYDHYAAQPVHYIPPHD